jgi:type II secretory pathway pseudopilin PulG
MPNMWWWVLGVVAVLLAAAYLGWLGARVNRLHRRAQTATAALDAALVRRAAAAAVLAEQLSAEVTAEQLSAEVTAEQLSAEVTAPRSHHNGDGTATDRSVVAVAVTAGDLYATARAALDAEPVEREPAENDLTLALRRLPAQVGEPPPGWPAVTAASRRVALARQVHTDVVRDARSVRRRLLVRALGLARRHPEPAYFDIDDPGLDDPAADGHWAAEEDRAGHR